MKLAGESFSGVVGGIEKPFLTGIQALRNAQKLALLFFRKWIAPGPSFRTNLRSNRKGVLQGWEKYRATALPMGWYGVMFLG